MELIITRDSIMTDFIAQTKLHFRCIITNARKNPHILHIDDSDKSLKVTIPNHRVISQARREVETWRKIGENNKKIQFKFSSPPIRI